MNLDHIGFVNEFLARKREPEPFVIGVASERMNERLSHLKTFLCCRRDKSHQEFQSKHVNPYGRFKLNMETRDLN